MSNNISRVPQSATTASSKKRLVRVATKVNEKQLIDQSLENDFKLEEGDPTEFLKYRDSTHNTINSRESQSRLSSVGSQRILDLHKERSEIASGIGPRPEPNRRRFTMKSFFRPVIENEVQIYSKISIITHRIEENKKNFQIKLRTMNSMDRMMHLQQLTCLKKFEKTQKNWQKIENGLKKKSKKQTEQLLSKKPKEVPESDLQPTVPWCTTLRNTGKQSILEELIPVGNKLSGIYVKKIISIAPPTHRKSSSCPDLTIHGCSKLPLEIEASKRPGSKLFNRIEAEDRYHEETFAENYSSRASKLWAN